MVENEGTVNTGVEPESKFTKAAKDVGFLQERNTARKGADGIIIIIIPQLRSYATPNLSARQRAPSNTRAWVVVDVALTHQS
jgi:hypothetical protein